MALINQATNLIGDRLPKVISPRAHAWIDYAAAATFFLLAALSWKSNRRAAWAALACGTAEVTNALITDFPGGVKPLISFETHGKVDVTMAGAVSSLPNMLGFAHQPEATYFRAQGLAVATVTALTDFKNEGNGSEYEAA
jgi:hypothetical protein